MTITSKTISPCFSGNEPRAAAGSFRRRAVRVFRLGLIPALMLGAPTFSIADSAKTDGTRPVKKLPRGAAIVSPEQWTGAAIFVRPGGYRKLPGKSLPGKSGGRQDGQTVQRQKDGITPGLPSPGQTRPLPLPGAGVGTGNAPDQEQNNRLPSVFSSEISRTKKQPVQPEAGYLGMDRPFHNIGSGLRLFMDLGNLAGFDADDPTQESAAPGKRENEGPIGTETGTRADSLKTTKMTIEDTGGPVRLRVQPGNALEFNGRKYLVIGRKPGFLLMRDRATGKLVRVRERQTPAGPVYRIKPAKTSRNSESAGNSPGSLNAGAPLPATPGSRERPAPQSVDSR